MVRTNFPYTFYNLYTKQDRRQPLPSVFTAHFIDGGTGGFNTNFQIWRESVVAPERCPLTLSSNSAVRIADEVRFDEHEMPTYPAAALDAITDPRFPSTSNAPSSSLRFPPFSGFGDVAGWLYLNLNTAKHGVRPSQGWVVTSMSAEGRFEVEMAINHTGEAAEYIEFRSADATMRTRFGFVPTVAFADGIRRLHGFLLRQANGAGQPART